MAFILSLGIFASGGAESVSETPSVDEYDLEVSTMAVVENKFVCDLKKPVQAQALKGNVFSLDNLGSRLSVLIYENGVPATISGSITADCILPDGSTVTVNGGLTTENGGSKAYVDVPQSCLLIPGILKIAIKCTSSSVITTLAAIVANVYMTKTDNVITPSQQVITDWNAEISASLANQNAEISDLKSALNDVTNETRNFFDYKGYVSAVNGSVVAERDNITISANASGNQNARTIFKTAKKVSDLSGKTVYLSGICDSTLSGNDSSFMVQIGIFENDTFTNKQSNFAPASGGAFSASWEVPAALVTSNPNALIALRLYQGYGLSVQTTDKTTYKNIQLATSSQSYVPFLTACDYVLESETPCNKGSITVSGLNLNTGDFIHPGMWALVNMTYKPTNYPSNEPGRIISFTSSTNSSFATIQIVVDSTNTIYERYSNANGTWSDWVVIASNGYVDSQIAGTVFNKGTITSTGLDLNTGDFIHPGMWALVDTTKMPAHYPSTEAGRIISFTSTSSSSFATYQIVIDISGIVYERFSNANGTWSNWKSNTPKHKGIAFETVFTNSESFVNDYDITADWSTSSGRVASLMALYDAVSGTGVTVTKDTLGKDASDTFNIYNYKVSNGIGTKPVVLIIVGEHGDENNSAMLGYYLYREIVTGVLKKYLTFVDFWVVPLMNPYGYEHTTRNNYNDVNLNRDFPCMWEYSTVQHNKTGNYSLSQPESVLIYNLITTNKNKILFMCNKHDTGSITVKINNSQPDKCCYTASVMASDAVVNRGLAKWQDIQAKTTDPWLVTECNTDMSGTQMIVSRDGHVTAGSLDLFANSIGVHGSLLECCISAGWDGQTPAQYQTDHAKDMARLGLDYFVNWVAQSIENNKFMLDDDTLLADLKYYTRKQVDSEWTLVEQYWNGNALINVP